MKLRSRIHLYSSALFAVLLVAMNLSVYALFSKLTMTSQMERVEAEALKISEGMLKSAGTVPIADLLRAYVPLNGMLRMVTAEGADKLLVTAPSEQQLSEREAVYAAEKRIESIDFKGNSYALVSIPVIWTDGAVVNIQVTESVQDTADQLKVLQIVLLAVTAIAMIPVVASGRLLGSIIVRPIAHMTHTMRAIQRSGTFIKIQPEGQSQDELAEMGATFNEMIALLETNFEKQEQFVSNASHELKTPLTVIESYASLLKRRGLDRPDLFVESIDAIHSEAVRMKEMTEQLLMLARNKEQWNLTMESVDLAQLASESSKAFQKAYGRDIQVRLASASSSGSESSGGKVDRAGLEAAEFPPSSEVGADGGIPGIYGYADANKLRQLLFILLDNARKYSSAAITLEVGASSDYSVIRVIDRGIGIPQAALSKVFDRFYRVDEARSRQDVGGAGLGLALAKEIAAAIGASLTLASEEGVGTTATIKVKRTEAEK
ncbi:two-component sensor histidine kinase [Paenibacillus sp. BIHB 4019]|uniref:histidine kinase n=1 Tax=Paenibacillus sp. BIHB 4019 TaxID=1870819 RepID=A0A1B2DJY5_9BACL|nr:HAMP domain-containing sensor histidine kinase [Paenibacillus sp. BIHB 4019]ANY68023.1 two-component sensor histidine kinase [Paenibacillus sp. BIHB 4019]